jgi:hypothetical protein
VPLSFIDILHLGHIEVLEQRDVEASLEIAAGDGTTNIAFGEGEKVLYVTVVKNPNDPQAKGSVVRISNVE